MNDETLKQKFTRKLEECLAYERTVLQLYEDLIGKCGHARELMLVQDELVHYLDESGEHLRYLEGLREQADAAGADLPDYTVSEAVGQTLQNLMNDSLAPIIQNLEVVLVAELVDGFHWRLLADIAAKLNRKEVSTYLKYRDLQKQDHADGIQLIVHELYVRENFLGD